MRILYLAFVCALAAGSAWAQESRGAISGKVTDQQGAVVPGALVLVTNTETNLSFRTSTNQTGYFEANLLNPGTYSVSVEAPGFKKSVRGGLELSVAGRLQIAVQLEVGQVTETVQVTAEAPLLDTTTASGGRIIDNRQIMELPFSDMNPFALATIAPGMQWTGQPEYRRPFDNAGTSSFNTMGGVGSNEYTIDGAPVTGTGRRVGFVPPSDAVEEFKLETATFDAAYGHTSGATVNVMTKAGTNTYHGSLYDQHWQQRWNATPHFTRNAFVQAVASGKKKANDQRQGPGRSNNFGGTLGGPVRLPKLYNGTDKLFFFFSYNGIYQSKAETTSSVNRTVPKMAWRQGDFSDLQAIDATKYTIYDPRSARLVKGHVVRTPFPGNRGIPVLNSMYKYYEPLYPKPNDVSGLVSPEGFNNYLAYAMPKDERFNALVNRVDYNISERHRVFGRWYWNHRLANEYDWTYETKRGLHANGLTRINKGVGADYIWTIGSSSVLDIGGNWTRFNEGSDSPVRTTYTAAGVGLPAYLDAKAGSFHELPRLNFNNLEDVSNSYPVIGTRGTTGELKVSMTTLRGNHSLKYGWQERRYWFTGAGPGNSTGSFSFNNSWMRASDDTRTASNHGLEWASFMMGMPSGMSIDTNDSAYWSTRYRALYFQDDVRITDRFRVNLGLRYEREGGITERYNRGLSGAFQFDAKLPFTDLAQAAYAKNPLAELPASQFHVLGGVPYLGQPDKTFTDGTHHFLPRLGIVYQINSKTVVRAGYGWYYDTFNPNNDRPSQYGYSQPTSTSLSNDNGLTFCCGVGAAEGIGSGHTPLNDPFPVRTDGTRFNAPYGNSLGLMAQQGRGYTFRPRDYSPAWQQRWRLGVQREITRNMVVEVSYNGAFSRLPVNQRVDYLPEKYWASGNTRNQAIDNDLNSNVPNPFNIKNLAPLESSNPLIYNYLRTVGFFTGSSIRKSQLLRAFPQMNGLNGVRPGNSFADVRGGNKYHDVQFQFEKRFARGFQTSVLYTRAYSVEQDYYFNEFDSAPTYRANNDVRPHRLAWTGIYELPFGRGHRLQKPILNHAIGGWQFSWVYQYQSGPVPDWGNRFFYGDMSKIGSLFQHDAVHSRDIHAWFDPAISFTGAGAVPQNFQGFEGRSAMQPGQYHRRVFPSRIDSMRADGIRNWDLKALKRFHVTERLRTTFSVDFLNAFNHTNFSGPNTDPTNKNFGRVTSQRGLSRVIQFNLRMDF